MIAPIDVAVTNGAPQRKGYVPPMQEVQVPSPGRARTLSPTHTSEAAQSSDCEVEGTNICRSEMTSSPESCSIREDAPPTTDDGQFQSINYFEHSLTELENSKLRW